MKFESNELQELIDAITHTKFSFQAIVDALKNGEIYRKGLLDRAPFKKGDRVVLIETPVINEEVAWGWMGSKHFLIKGAKGTVSELDFYEGAFRAGVHFDNESWIDSDGNIHPREEPHQYWFSEKWLVKI